MLPPGDMVAHPYRRPAVVASDARDEPSPRFWHVVAVTLVAVPMLALAALFDRDASDGVRSLDPRARDAFYERTRENVRMCNDAGVEELQSFCQDQRELLRVFPECDESCERLARRADVCVRC